MKDVEATEDKGSLHAGNCSHETETHSRQDESIGKIEYPQHDNLKVDSDDGSKTNGYGEAEDTTRLEHVDRLCKKRDGNCPPLSLMTNLISLDLSSIA